VLKLKPLMRFAFVSLAIVSLACDAVDATPKPDATPAPATTDAKPLPPGKKAPVPTNAPSNKAL
jgi:hypothetical protein